MEEMIEVLDENGKKTGVIKPKSQIKKDGDFHKAISILIINSKKGILIQRRSHEKRVYPDLWSIFLRGHIRAHEESIDACMRELEEELGLKVSKEEIKFTHISKHNDIDHGYINNIFFDNYILNTDIRDFKLGDEVSETKFISLKELEGLIEARDSKLVPNFDEYDKVIDILKSYKM
jgi:isopentenyldiphosphate isomerase